MLKTLIAAGALTLFPAAAGAVVQIVLTPGSVVANSGSYSSQFLAGNILDAQTGAILEPVQANYWLNPDGGPAAAFITVDLGRAYRDLNFDLFNTHNAQYDDRGTGNFTITGGNTIAANAVTLISGTLSPEAGVGTVLTAQSFGAENSTGYRYIRFNPTSVSVGGSPCCGANNYGLNELRVFGTAVPEPATWGLMIAGFAMTGFAARRRRTIVAA